MKKKCLLFAVLLFLSCIYNKLDAQDLIRQRPCNNPSISAQADSIKSVYIKQGYAVVKESPVSMESQYEMPVIFPLVQESWYQFIFIGDVSSRLFEVRMYDWSEKQVFYQKNTRGDQNANIINFSYVPPSSEQYMIKLMQINRSKKDQLCGYLLLMKRVK